LTRQVLPLQQIIAPDMPAAAGMMRGFLRGSSAADFGVFRDRADRAARGWGAQAGSAAAQNGNDLVIIDGLATVDGESATPASTYLAQHIAQEVLPDGIYLDPHAAGVSAYRDVLNVVAAYSAPPSGFDLSV